MFIEFGLFRMLIDRCFESFTEKDVLTTFLEKFDGFEELGKEKKKKVLTYILNHINKTKMEMEYNQKNIFVYTFIVRLFKLYFIYFSSKASEAGWYTRVLEFGEEKMKNGEWNENRYLTHCNNLKKCKEIEETLEEGCYCKIIGSIVDGLFDDNGVKIERNFLKIIDLGCGFDKDNYCIV